MTGNPRPVTPCKQGIKGRRLKPFVAQFVAAMIAAFDWVITEKNRAQGINKVKPHIHTATADDYAAVIVQSPAGKCSGVS